MFLIPGAVDGGRRCQIEYTVMKIDPAGAAVCTAHLMLR
jgi:hypothetical protein